MSVKTGVWKYVNHLGETFSSQGFKVFIQENSVFDYSWDYENTNTRVTKLSQKMREIALPIYLNADTDNEGLDLRNKLYEITEKDVLAKEPGRLYFGDWYLTGYVIGSEKSGFMQCDRRMGVNLKFIAESKRWRKDQLITLRPQEIEEQRKQLDPITTGKPGSVEKAMPDKVIFHEFPYDYFKQSTIHSIYPQYDYAFDYVKSHGKSAIINESFTGSDFIMTIYGFCIHPIITIGGHPYGVDVVVYEGERLVIDSQAGTVMKTGRLGEVTNCFNARDKAYSIFEPIPSGRSSLVWPGTYGIDLCIFEERSEPKWTKDF